VAPTSFTSVPIVEIGGLRSPDRAQTRTGSSRIGKAAREIGFFYCQRHGHRRRAVREHAGRDEGILRAPRSTR